MQVMSTIIEKRATPHGGSSTSLWIGLAGLVCALLAIVMGVGSYNGLVTLDQTVKSQWAQVENTYQRRADLVPNLVSTVKGAAAFERETLTAVTEARARVGKEAAAAPKNLPDDPAAFAKFQKAEDALSSSLSHLMVVVERYPDLHATQNFRDLQAQLEGTENRIAVARMRFNEGAQAFNTERSSFPTVIMASLFGGRFGEKAYFAATPGAQTPPAVDFRTP
jgi:LemA protein